MCINIEHWTSKQEYEKLKADARSRGSGQREEMADVERQLASSRSKLDQLRSEQVRLSRHEHSHDIN